MTHENAGQFPAQHPAQHPAGTSRAGQTDPGATPGPRFVVVGPDGSATAEPEPGDDGPDQGELDAAVGPESIGAFVDQPAKVMRIGMMIKQLLEEVRSAPLDDAARIRLATIHERSLLELEDGLSPELVAELHRITLPLGEDPAPSDAELRIAQAQLVGWLEGLFHGIQTALVAQQVAAQSQLAQIRKALPQSPTAQSPGQYL